MTPTRRPSKPLLVVLAALTAGWGCSFLVDYEHEGKPCNHDLECLEGYQCYQADAALPVCLSPENAEGWTPVTATDAN